MTLADLGALIVIAVYAILGWYSGTIRRILGLIAIYVALLVATNIGQYAGGIVRQFDASISVPDSRLLGWLFFCALLILALEGAATAVHAQLQLAVVALNKAVGLVLGIVSGVVLVVAVAFMLIGFTDATNGQSSSPNQFKVRDQLQHSAVLVPLARATSGLILPLLTATLPRDPAAWYVYQSPSSS